MSEENESGEWIIFRIILIRIIFYDALWADVGNALNVELKCAVNKK